MAALLSLLQVCSQTPTSFVEQLIALNDVGKYEKHSFSAGLIRKISNKSTTFGYEICRLTQLSCFS